MSFYKFEEGDIVNTYMMTFPKYTVELNGSSVTGSVFLEKKFLNASLEDRIWMGYSEKEGGYQEKDGPFSSSIDILDAELGATNKEFYKSILRLYNHYSLLDSSYTHQITGSDTIRFRVITIPEIYYDNSILTGSFTASDYDAAGTQRFLYDNGNGGIYSGSVTGSIVGNIFYNEGFVVLKGGGLNDEVASNDFGESSPNNHKWKISSKGTHKIPVKMFNCRAKSGELNASSNPTFYTIPTASGDPLRNQKKILIDNSPTYVTAIGLYNEDYELVGYAKLAQPIKKNLSSDILFRIRMDF